MFCTIDADGYPDAVFSALAPGNPDIVFVSDDDPKAIARAAEDTPKMRANAKAALSRAVDDAAEALRLTLITPGSGQSMEYQEAYAQAKLVQAQVVAGQTPDPTAFPMLAASIGVDKDPQTGAPTVDLAGEARSVIAAYGAYLQAGATIRGVRLKAKAAIAAAPTAPDAKAAFLAIQWPSFG